MSSYAKIKKKNLQDLDYGLSTGFAKGALNYFL